MKSSLSSGKAANPQLRAKQALAAGSTVTKRKIRDDDEPIKKKKKIVVDDDPPIRKKKKKIVVDDDPPIRKKKKRAVEDEVEPVKKKKKLEVVEASPPKKRAKPLAIAYDDEDDEDEEDDGDIPIRKVPAKSKSTALALTTDDVLGKISKLRAKEGKNLASSILGDGVEAILQMLEKSDFDTATTMILKRTLQDTLDLIPLAASAVRKSKGARGVYQYNSLIASMRELVVDIQSSQDRGMLGQALTETILRPGFAEIATMVLQEYAIIKGDAKAAIVTGNKASEEAEMKEYHRFCSLIDASRTRIAAGMTQSYRSMMDEAVSFLQR